MPDQNPNHLDNDESIGGATGMRGFARRACQDEPGNVKMPESKALPREHGGAMAQAMQDCLLDG
ncbi:hypothetical protein [Burkholderia sp. Z1]|uniref:hypothetical protein n=1 Tax=Burkholderia sp. Z1 TaxID=2759039 RepID=UPI001867C868|nr:hypothetical protein [Burkholderia sp. Z1]